MAENENQNQEPQAQDNKHNAKSKDSGGTYKMVSHVDGPVKESGSDEFRYVPAYEPFYVDQEEAFKLLDEGRAKFVKPGEDDSASSLEDGESAYEEYKDKKREEKAAASKWLSSNELKPKSASSGMKAATAAESNTMPAGSDDLAVADHSVFVVADRMYDGVRGKFVDHEEVKADAEAEAK